MITIGTTANAAANGGLLVKLEYTTVPMNWFLLTSETAMKSPRVSENVKIEPATIAGKTSGQITLRIVVHGSAPRSSDALKSEFVIR